MHLISIFVPMMVSYLVESDKLSSAPKVARLLHDSALQRLVKIGPQSPAHFRSIMQSRPELKTRLEAAVKTQQETAASGSGQVKGQGHNKAGMLSQPAKPSIKLKMDFSNFSG